MAQRVLIERIDDLDCTNEADETVHFGLDGAVYEMDLCAANAERLRDVFSAYITAGRKTGGTLRRRPGVTPPLARNQPPRDTESAAIRVWARAQGIHVPLRGRVPLAVQEAYEAAAKEPPVTEVPFAEAAPAKRSRVAAAAKAKASTTSPARRARKR